MTTGRNSPAESKTEIDLPELLRDMLDCQATYSRAQLELSVAREKLTEALKEKYGHDVDSEEQPKKIVVEDMGPRMNRSPKAYYIVTYHIDTGTFDIQRSD